MSAAEPWTGIFPYGPVDISGELTLRELTEAYLNGSLGRLEPTHMLVSAVMREKIFRMCAAMGQDNVPMFQRFMGADICVMQRLPEDAIWFVGGSREVHFREWKKDV